MKLTNYATFSQNIPKGISCLLIITLIVPLIGEIHSKDPDGSTADINFREVKDPFRIGKLNSVWHKALHKLTDTKLKSLYTELSAHDKEQVKLKRLKSDGLDQEGLQEASVRKRFREILTDYNLLAHFEDGAIPSKPSKSTKDSSKDENEVNKSLFKDKKLAKLWEKAEKSGFDQKELKFLKEEFFHHQDKIDEYYSLLEKEDGDRPSNFLHPLDDLEHMDHMDKSKLPSKKYPDGGLPVVNNVKTKHRDIKDGYDVLHKKISRGKDSTEFSEPRVSNLWKIAQNADFSEDELESLRTELKHYEKRLEKLQFFQSEYLSKKMHTNLEGKEWEKEHLHTDKDVSSFYADKIKRQERTIEKLHMDLEAKILNRHNEL